MIDFHNHVLPNVDDGRKAYDESMAMIRHASYQGITDIVQTIHFQHPKMDNKNVDYDYLNNEVDKLQLLINKENLNIKIYLSAEVFYLPNLTEIMNNPLVTLGNKKYMLIEFNTNIFPTGFEEEFFKLQTNGITPIIAHPERYRFVKNDINILEKWINRGYVIQLDAGSVLGYFGTHIKEVASNMLENNFIHLIGSDAHNNKKRNFCLLDGYKIIEETYSADLVKQLKENVERILSGKKVININDSNKGIFTTKKKSSYLKEKILSFFKLSK